MFNKILCFLITAVAVLLLSCDYGGKSKQNSPQNPNIPAENPTDDLPDNNPLIIKLGSLETSSGILTPEFNPDTMQYSVVLTPDISELTITSRPSEGCNVKVNDSPVTSEQQYSTIIKVLQPQTDINILVSAENSGSALYTLLIIKPVEKPVENSSFEIYNEQNYPSGWKLAGSGEFISSNEFSNSGSFSGTFTTLTSSISGREIISAPVQIEQGKDINVSAWFYIPAIDDLPAERSRLSLKLYYYTDADCLYPAATAYDTMTKTSLNQQGVWEKISYVPAKENIPADTRFIRIGIRACFDNTKGGTKNDKIFIDDVSLQQ